MEETPARLTLESVSKRYYIREPRGFHRAARVAMASWASERRKEMWAVRDVSFDLKAGSSLGIIGLNGSGKSTLLKLIAGVTAPTEGRIETQGPLVALLELGAGFHPDLTGYQNVYLQGNLMGLSKSQIDACLGSIVDFSGLDRFMEWPVKRYSTGMYARLGFSIALHVEARIILIDEILSVGDIDFQKRGLERMRQIRDEGKSIMVLVTHNTEMACDFCDETIWLDSGNVVERGDAYSVASSYRRHVMPLVLASSDYSTDRDLIERIGKLMVEDSPLRILNIGFRDADGATVESIESGKPVVVAVEVESDRPLKGIDFLLILVRDDQLPLAEIQSSELDKSIDLPAGRSEILVKLDPQLILCEKITCTVAIAEDSSRQRYFAAAFHEGALDIHSDLVSSAAFTIAQPHKWIDRT